MISAIDVNHHFWDVSRGDYSWTAPAYEPINGVFASEDSNPLLVVAAVDGTVLVQTWSNRQETKEYLDIAVSIDFVNGVVGCVDLTAETVSKELDGLLLGPNTDLVNGIRHRVQDEPDPDWLRRSDVIAELLQPRNPDLGFDVLIRRREIPVPLYAAGRFPVMRSRQQPQVDIGHRKKRDLKTLIRRTSQYAASQCGRRLQAGGL